MSLARNVATVGMAAFVSRILGFARDMLMAAAFGVGAVTDAFVVAFQLPNVARRLLAEGALNASFVPLYLRTRDEEGEAKAGAFAGEISGALISALGALSLVLALVMPALIVVLAPGFALSDARLALAVDYARWMLPYLVIAGPLAALAGVLNANHRFALAALAPAAFNLCLIAVLLTSFAPGARRDAGAAAFAIAVPAAGLLQLALLAAAVWLGSERATPLRFSFGPAAQRFFKLAGPGLVTSALPQLAIVAATMIVSVAPNAVSWIYYANRLVELPLGMVSVAIGTVLVPAFAHAVRSGERAALARAQSRGLELALGLSLPAAVGIAVLAEPIVRALFERGAFTPHDTAATAAALAALALGVPAHVLAKVFAPLFYAREDTRTPMRAALIALGMAAAGGLALMPLAGHAGVALALALAAWANAAILARLVSRRVGLAVDAQARRRLPRIGLAAAGMGLVLSLAQPQWAAMTAPGSELGALGLAGLVAAGLLVYGALLLLFGVTTARAAIEALRRRA